jgi:hypothetical protein
MEAMERARGYCTHRKNGQNKKKTHSRIFLDSDVDAVETQGLPSAFRWDVTVMLHLKQLVRLSDEQLANLDVAEVNLACAEGLPRAEQIPYAECVDRLNHYARCVHDYTERRRLLCPGDVAQYDGSEELFRVVCMISVLQKVFGVYYNPAKKPIDAPFDTEDIFIHGALVGGGGTCASLPVIYAAVGRRLGYPLKLVSTRGHVLPQSKQEFAFVRVSGNTLAEEPS